MRVELQLAATLPVLAPLVAAVLVLVLDAAVPRQRVLHLGVAALGLVGGAVAALPGLGLAAGDRRSAFCLATGECLYAADRLVSALQVAALLGALVVLVLAWRDWASPSGGDRAPVVTALLLGATGGVVAVPAAGDLGTLLVALELATLPTVALVALTHPAWSAERRARSVEGAVALLTTSLVSFGLLAMGAALWVAATGTALLASSPVARQPVLLLLASVFVLAGLAFKVSAVPFHAWTPITYATAPLPVTAYLATVSKVAALGALVVLVRALGSVDGTTLLAVALLAALSMTVGNLVALVQTDTVRLLAWSTVAQAGWVLLPLASLSSRAASAAGSYLLVYVAATLLAFVVVVVVAHDQGDTTLEGQRGLLRARPLLALPLGLALLTLAGLPPAVAGLVAKVVALRPVVGDGTWWLAVVAAVNVAVGIAVYVRWFAALLSAPDAATVRPGGPRPAETTEPVPVAEAVSTADGVPVSPTGELTPPAAALPGQHERHTPREWWVLVAVLTALLVLGSVAPIGIV